LAAGKRPWPGATLEAYADGYGRVEMEASFTKSATVDVELDAQATVSGRLIAADTGEPVVGAKVTANAKLDPGARVVHEHGISSTSAWFATAGRTVSGANGAFDIAGLAPGRYKMQVAHDEFACGGSEALPSFDLKAGEQLREMELRVQRSAIVEGIIVRQGNPVAWSAIWFAEVGGDRRSRVACYTSSIADGSFRARVAMTTFNRISVYDQSRQVPGPGTSEIAPGTLVVDKPRITGVVIELPSNPAESAAQSK
jgi:hypothetical protein